MKKKDSIDQVIVEIGGVLYKLTSIAYDSCWPCILCALNDFCGNGNDVKRLCTYYRGVKGALARYEKLGRRDTRSVSNKVQMNDRKHEKDIDKGTL